MRGEYYCLHATSAVSIGSPPLARGVPSSSAYLFLHSRITPACAGSTVYRILCSVVFKDHPRLRGEYKIRSRISWADTGSPPLARGVRYRKRRMQSKRGITPACAGSTLSGGLHCSLLEDHPRLRGEYDASRR